VSQRAGLGSRGVSSHTVDGQDPVGPNHAFSLRPLILRLQPQRPPYEREHIAQSGSNDEYIDAGGCHRREHPMNDDEGHSNAVYGHHPHDPAFVGDSSASVLIRERIDSPAALRRDSPAQETLGHGPPPTRTLARSESIAHAPAPIFRTHMPHAQRYEPARQTSPYPRRTPTPSTRRSSATHLAPPFHMSAPSAHRSPSTHPSSLPYTASALIQRSISTHLSLSPLRAPTPSAMRSTPAHHPLPLRMPRPLAAIPMSALSPSDSFSSAMTQHHAAGLPPGSGWQHRSKSSSSSVMFNHTALVRPVDYASHRPPIQQANVSERPASLRSAEGVHSLAPHASNSAFQEYLLGRSQARITSPLSRHSMPSRPSECDPSSYRTHVMAGSHLHVNPPDEIRSHA
jgi:hypothetical protein